jgi:flagellar biosynthesis protein FlhG
MRWFAKFLYTDKKQDVPDDMADRKHAVKNRLWELRPETDKSRDIPDYKSRSEQPAKALLWDPLPGPKIWAIGGGKGGVGKSLVTSNLGILLARAGKKTLMVDADLGTANLHTFVKAEQGNLSLSNFLFTGELSDIQHLISKTSIPNLDLISGAKDSLDVADLNGNKIMRLQEVLRRVEHDYVLLDIGPGTSSNNLELFLMADEGILVTSSEPTSIENTYRFLKCLVFRRIKKILDSENGELKVLLDNIIKDKVGNPVMSIKDTLTQLKRMDRNGGQILNEIMGDINLSVIINQTKRPEDMELGPLVKKACRDYFGLEIDCLGHIGYDDSVGDSVVQRNPLITHHTLCGAAKAIEACFRRLLEKTNNVEHQI